MIERSVGPDYNTYCVHVECRADDKTRIGYAAGTNERTEITRRSAVSDGPIRGIAYQPVLSLHLSLSFLHFPLDHDGQAFVPRKVQVVVPIPWPHSDTRSPLAMHFDFDPLPDAFQAYRTGD